MKTEMIFDVQSFEWYNSACILNIAWYIVSLIWTYNWYNDEKEKQGRKTARHIALAKCVWYVVRWLDKNKLNVIIT